MSNKVKCAKILTELGFRVFPCIKNGKFPAKGGRYVDIATLNSKEYESYFKSNYNIGISTEKFKDGALLVVDIDNSPGKNGNQTVLSLELEGKEFPKTMKQITPRGGEHLIYFVKEAVKQGAHVLGQDIDVRSRGGYILGAGSTVKEGMYKIDKTPIAEAPAWMIEKCNEVKADKKKTKVASKKISQATAKPRAKEYLKLSAPLAIEGQGGDSTTFKVASRLKDIGISEKNAVKLMLSEWNDRCSPPWDARELEAKVRNAYAYGQNEVGADAPENDFDVVPVQDDKNKKDDPVAKLNKKFAFAVLGGKSTIIKENAKGEPTYMTPGAFHDLLAAEKVQMGKGWKQLSEVWFCSSKRRTYESIELRPLKETPPDVYNLWRGFACEPISKDKATKDMKKGLAMFQEHAFKNICLENQELYNWLMGYFAHLIQKPWEKPLTCLVFRGRKGVGKNALVDRIGRLFNSHYMVASNKRYLTSNFNKHFANLLFLVLDEAFWSGDKAAEGILKDLITGNEIHIEHKGKETFSVKNLIRTCIIGNEKWVVPASEDERRFAIFTIGEGRMQDKEFFSKMRTLIDSKGGNRLLLNYLQNFDLSSIDVNDAPLTEGLLEQKIESLNTVHKWWYGSIKEGAILNLDFNEEWPETIGRDQLRNAYSMYAKNRGVRSWLPDASAFGRDLIDCCPGVTTKRVREGDVRKRVYALPPLDECREYFDKFIGHKIDWVDLEDEEIAGESAKVIDMFS